MLGNIVTDQICRAALAACCAAGVRLVAVMRKDCRLSAAQTRSLAFTLSSLANTRNWHSHKFSTKKALH